VSGGAAFATAALAVILSRCRSGSAAGATSAPLTRRGDHWGRRGRHRSGEISGGRLIGRILIALFRAKKNSDLLKEKKRKKKKEKRKRKRKEKRGGGEREEIVSRGPAKQNFFFAFFGPWTNNIRQTEL
jgi:hypothetical protein